MAEMFDISRPIYAQLAERLEQRIAAGEYRPGQRLAPVREMAAEAGVNPNTMQRAMAELERRGLVKTERTAGRFVTEDEACIAAVKQNSAEKKVDTFVQEMKRLGFTRRQLAEMILKKEEEEWKNC